MSEGFAVGEGGEGGGFFEVGSKGTLVWEAKGVAYLLDGVVGFVEHHFCFKDYAFVNPLFEGFSGGADYDAAEVAWGNEEVVGIETDVAVRDGMDFYHVHEAVKQPGVRFNLIVFGSVMWGKT